MSEKRSHPRVQTELSLVIEANGVSHHARSRDISIGGIFVHTNAPLPFGADVKIRVELPALKEESCIEGTVRWHRDGGAGLSFKSLRAREVWAINQLLKMQATG